MKDHKIYILFVLTVVLIFRIAYFFDNKNNTEKAYMKGYNEGFYDVLNALQSNKRRAIDSCDVIALPTIKDGTKIDTVVYFLSSRFCNELDTVISPRFERAN